MDQTPKLIKKVFSKSQYPRTIDTNFNELGVTSVNEDLEAGVSVEDFFNLYNELFYDIPLLGDTNSHQFLIETSSEYSEFKVNQEEFNALRAEVTSLRKELLEEQIKNIELTTNTKIDTSEIGETLKSISDIESNVSNNI